MTSGKVVDPTFFELRITISTHGTNERGDQGAKTKSTHTVLTRSNILVKSVTLTEFLPKKT